MAIRTTTNLLALCVVLGASGCATTGDESLGTIAANQLRAHADAVRAIHRADRAALGQVAALFRETFGARGTVVERSEPYQPIAIQHSESVSMRSPVTGVVPHPEPVLPKVDELQAIEMAVGPAEMLTAEGTLHPRAARALAQMNEMAREHGGDFTVAVPRSQLHTASAIQEVAPGATILTTDDDEYRLIVVAPDR